MGALLGDQVVFAGAGDLVFKPRDQWHTFWNAGETACRILEIISPGGFEHFFEEVVGPGASAIDWQARYGTETDLAATSRIRDQFGLIFPLRSSPI